MSARTFDAAVVNAAVAGAMEPGGAADAVLMRVCRAIGGTVKAAASGEPLQGAKVVLMRGDQAVTEVVTAEGGGFVFPPQPAGVEYTLGAPLARFLIVVSALTRSARSTEQRSAAQRSAPQFCRMHTRVFFVLLRLAALQQWSPAQRLTPAASSGATPWRVCARRWTTERRWPPTWRSS